MFEVTQRSVRTLSVVVLHAPFFAAGSDSAACLPSTRLDARWCRHLLLQQHCVGVGTHGHTPEQKPRCISMPVHWSSPCRPLVFGGAVVQVVTVLEGCHDADIGSDPHRRGHGVQLRLSPASPFQRRSRSQWNFLCVGHSIRHKICYQVRLRLTWRLMEVELGVQIYPGGCPGTSVHPVSVGCQQVVQEHGRTSGRCRCGSLGDEWPATPLGLQLAHSRAQGRHLPLLQLKAASVRPSKAALEQNPSSPRDLATALGSPHSDTNAPKSNRLAMLAVRCCNFADAAQSARFSPCLSLYPFSPPPQLNNRPLSALHPLFATTPLPPLPPSRFLSSGHHGTSVLSCPPPPPPSLPPSRGHLVFKLKFT